MIIHQIFLKVSDKTLEDYPIYVEGIKIWKKWCLDNGYEYKLWTEIPYELLDDYDKDMLKDCMDRFTFSAIDFIRMPILENYGGMYVDLDVIPTHKLINIMDRENIFGTGYTDKKIFITNNVMKCSKKNSRKMRLYSRECYEEKKQIKIYDKWVKRFFLRTVGASMVCNFCKKYLKYEMIPKNEFIECFTDHMTKAWSDNSAVKKQLKKITPVISNMVDLKIDDEVNVLKGQWKGYTGRMTTVRPTYCSMLLLTDKFGNKVEGNITGKVKRDFLEKKAPNPIEMPTADQLVLVDTDGFVEDENVSSIDSLTDNLKEQLKNDAIKGIMIHETGVSEPAMTMDDAYCIRDERDKLKLQVQSMLGFQGTACSEIADLQLEIKKLKDELAVCNNDKLQRIKKILDE